VVQASEDFVRVYVDCTVASSLRKDCVSDLMKKYGVTGFPTVLFLGPDGAVLKKMCGNCDPAEFLEAMSAIGGPWRPESPLRRGPAEVSAGARTWSFSSEDVGKPPSGFEFTTTRETPAGRWEVIDDEGTPILAQLDEDTTDGRFAVAVASDASYRDLRLTVRGKPVRGQHDQAVGLVWRFQDADNYYVARLNPLEANVRLYRVVNGNRIKFAGREKVDLRTGTWYTLEIMHRGEHIAVSLDGTVLFEADDRTIPDAGKVGVWIKADSVTYFSDLTAEELK